RYAGTRSASISAPSATHSSARKRGTGTTPSAPRHASPRPARPMTAPYMPTGRWRTDWRASLRPQVVALDQRVLLQLGHRPALEHDLAVDDDVAAAGDADRLVEVLLGHEHRETVLVLQLLDLGDGVRD